MGFLGGGRGLDVLEGGLDGWKERQGYGVYGPSGPRETILLTWGLGCDSGGVQGGGGIKGKVGKLFMELNRAMPYFPLPETLLSVILFF